MEIKLKNVKCKMKIEKWSKAANVLWDPNVHPVLADFGIAKQRRYKKIGK